MCSKNLAVLKDRILSQAGYSASPYTRPAVYSGSRLFRTGSRGSWSSAQRGFYPGRPSVLRSVSSGIRQLGDPSVSEAVSFE